MTSRKQYASGGPRIGRVGPSQVFELGCRSHLLNREALYSHNKRHLLHPAPGTTGDQEVSPHRKGASHPPP